MKKKLVMIFTMVLGLAACGDEPKAKEPEAAQAPVKVQAFDSPNRYDARIRYARIKVTAIVDQVEIKEVIVNRGNCQYAQGDIYKTRRYGQFLDLIFRGDPNCSPSQVDVITDSGTWTYNFDGS